MQKEYKKQPKILLWEITLKFKFETTHLGLRRTTSEENKIKVNDRISLARRTLYSDQNRRTWHKWTQPKNILQDIQSLCCPTHSIWTRNFRSSKQRFNGTVQVSSFLEHIETYSISCKQNSNISNLLASRSTADKC